MLSPTQVPVKSLLISSKRIVVLSHQLFVWLKSGEIKPQVDFSRKTMFH